MHISHSRSSKVVDFGTNRKGVCDFLLVVNSNFGPILHHLWDTATYWLKIANFPYTTLIKRPRSGWTRQNFWMKLITQKLEGWGENCMILTSTVFAWITRVSVTDRRTDRRNCDSICALSIYAVARSNDLLLAVDAGHVSVLCLLDPTTAFDSVYHQLCRYII